MISLTIRHLRKWAQVVRNNFGEFQPIFTPFKLHFKTFFFFADFHIQNLFSRMTKFLGKTFLGHQQLTGKLDRLKDFLTSFPSVRLY